MDNHIREEIEKNIMMFEPERYLQKYVNSVGDIYRHRSYLKNLPCSNYVVQSLANLILSAVKNRYRFRQFDCLKVLRSIVKDLHDPKLSSASISLLFELYRHYIFDSREEVQWCVSVFLKGRQVLDSELSWFIENYNKSEHILNRLLRYPTENKLIYSWAQKIYNYGGITGRNAELIALLIRNDIPKFIKHESSETLIWAVYYSRANSKVKTKILESLFSEKVFASFIDVCVRLNFVSVMKKALKNNG